MVARYTDREIYEAAVRHGDQTAAARELGLTASWIGKRVRAYAAANGLPAPRNTTGHLAPAPPVVRPDSWDHRRVADGGQRVHEQRRAPA